MAEAAAAPAAEAVPAPRKKIGLLVGLTLGGAVVGGLLAAFVVAPRIIARQAPAVADSAAAKAKPGKGGGDSEPAKLVELENIIVNPAGSQGNRFLMTSVALAVVNDKDAKLLDDHKVELRDKVTTILESMTMLQLTSPGARDSLKARIAAMTGEMLGGKASVKVFLPQFVIQ